ncbi:hypothetical protein AXK12_07045 [Cephaloticoccus capnophilus]|uniref:RNA-binding protein n=1 Tax=Cephaloticoccus capnophilus TaxID=1548208 RepID=A0A139SJH2_9BACT|nr:DUF721 domain-containing protein [Cephaloticoccus capnophilus]KXU34691.1 hypothetical protein AXK12_07045 [Cephaloticoccus capnophilus]
MTKPITEPHQFSQLAESVIADFRRVPLHEPKRQRKRATKPLAELVEPLLAKYKIGRESAEQRLHAHWAELVGSANANYSHPVEIDARGRLLVLASHAVVRQELFHHRAQIVAKIQALPGCATVKHLNIRAG